MSSRLLVQSNRFELIEKNSRFIGLAYPCQSLDEFKHRKAELEALYPDASHITYAFKIYSKGQVIIRFSDAGEPAGTAGKPILMHIEGQDLLNLVVFVVRYFGGTKLGAGGLVRAYGNTAKKLLLEASTTPFVLRTRLQLSFPYAAQSQIEYLSKKFGVNLSDFTYAEEVRVLATLPSDQKEAFTAAFAADVNWEEMSE